MMRLRSLGFSFRFIVPLALVLALVAVVVVPLIDDLTLRWFVRDLDIRSQLLANTIQEPLLEYVPLKSKKRINLKFPLPQGEFSHIFQSLEENLGFLALPTS